MLLTVVSIPGMFAQTEGGSEAFGFAAGTFDPASAGIAFTGAAASSSIAWSAFRNSAAIPFYDGKLDIQWAFRSWAPKGSASTDAALGAGFALGEKAGVSVGFAYLSGSEYEAFDANGAPKGTFKPSDMMVGAGFGMQFGEMFSAGLNVKMFRSSISDKDSYSAFAGDLMVMGRFGQGLQAAAGITNIGTAAKSSDGGAFNPPAAVTLAGNYSQAFQDVHTLDANLDLYYYLAGKVGAGLGLQYGWNDMVFLRAGYRFGTTGAVLPSFLSVGAGFKYKIVSLNLSYLTANEAIGNTVMIGIGINM